VPASLAFFNGIPKTEDPSSDRSLALWTGNPVGITARWGLRLSEQPTTESPDKEKAVLARAATLAGSQPVEIEVGDTIEFPKRDANTIRLRGQKTIYARIANAIVTTHRRRKSGVVTKAPKENVGDVKLTGINCVVFQDCVISPDFVQVLGSTRKPLQTWP
jgi:hypothetical protein